MSVIDTWARRTVRNDPVVRKAIEITGRGELANHLTLKKGEGLSSNPAWHPERVIYLPETRDDIEKEIRILNWKEQHLQDDINADDVPRITSWVMGSVFALGGGVVVYNSFQPLDSDFIADTRHQAQEALRDNCQLTPEVREQYNAAIKKSTETIEAKNIQVVLDISAEQNLKMRQCVEQAGNDAVTSAFAEHESYWKPAAVSAVGLIMAGVATYSYLKSRFDKARLNVVTDMNRKVLEYRRDVALAFERDVV